MGTDTGATPGSARRSLPTVVAMSFLSQPLSRVFFRALLRETLLPAVVDRVVGLPAVPAGPDDSHPRTRRIAWGCRLRRPGLPVELCRPGGGVPGVVGEGGVGLGGLGVGGPAKVHPSPLARLLGDRRRPHLGTRARSRRPSADPRRPPVNPWNGQKSRKISTPMSIWAPLVRRVR